MANPTRIPIDVQNPRVQTLAGGSYWSPEYLSTADQDMAFWTFRQDADGKFYGTVIVPNIIGATPLAKVILQVVANATVGVTRLSMSAAAVANGETLDVAKTAIVAQDVTVSGVAYAIKEVTFTLPTSGGSFPVQAKDQIDFEFFHEGLHANDTLAVNTSIKEAYLELDLS